MRRDFERDWRESLSHRVDDQWRTQNNTIKMGPRHDWSYAPDYDQWEFERHSTDGLRRRRPYRDMPRRGRRDDEYDYDRFESDAYDRPVRRGRPGGYERDDDYDRFAERRSDREGAFDRGYRGGPSEEHFGYDRDNDRRNAWGSREYEHELPVGRGWDYDRDFERDRGDYSTGEGRPYRGRRSSPEGEYLGAGDDYVGYSTGAFTGGPHAGTGPANYDRSDRIRETICERLTRHGGIDASDIHIRVENKEVTLEGTVPSRFAKRLADDVADSVPGVRDVHNHLRIKREATTRPAERSKTSRTTDTPGAKKK